MPQNKKSAERKRQLEQIDELAASGALTAEQAREAKARLGTPAAATPAVPATEPAPRPSRSMLLGIAAFAVVFAAAGYAWVGTPSAFGVGPGDAGTPSAAAPHSGNEQVGPMIERLAERLRTNPADAEGWAMLGRTYLVLGRHPEAVAALQKLRALRPDDAQVLADLADATAMAAGRVLAGEPERLIQRALELDPRNLKALALAGTIAFDRGDYAGAVRHWENAVAAGEPGSELVANLQSGIAEARQRGALAAAPSPKAASAAAAAAGRTVSGRVVLGAALAGKFAPEDTLFIFARAVDGPRVPLAMIKRRVGSGPLEFTLDDSTAMNDAMRLSGAAQVIVGARITKTGNAIAQPGDLEGFSKPVAVGARNVTVEIAEVVK
jgi:cytochrome c-type biogenesis protein CcmH